MEIVSTESAVKQLYDIGPGWVVECRWEFVSKTFGLGMYFHKSLFVGA